MPFTRRPGKGTTTGTENRSAAVRGWGRQEGLTTKGHRGMSGAMLVVLTELRASIKTHFTLRKLSGLQANKSQISAHFSIFMSAPHRTLVGYIPATRGFSSQPEDTWPVPPLPLPFPLSAFPALHLCTTCSPPCHLLREVFQPPQGPLCPPQTRVSFSDCTAGLFVILIILLIGLFA